MNGWFNVYKPKGVTSRYVVNKIKKQFKLKKVGHGGTLDPLAEGVLPIAIGEATKLIQYIMNNKKKYLFTVQFGHSTTTGDAEGDVKNKSNYIPSSLNEIQSICKQFIGKIKQRPHMFSAIRVNGVRSYELARKGIDFTLPYRDIEIFSLILDDFEKGKATFTTECSKGTYIRVLAEDIAIALNSQGFVTKLVRLEVGDFHIDNSMEIENLNDKFLLLPQYLLQNVPSIEVSEDLAKEIGNGKSIQLNNNLNNELIWIKYQDKIVAIGSIHNGYFSILRVFNLYKLE